MVPRTGIVFAGSIDGWVSGFELCLYAQLADHPESNPVQALRASGQCQMGIAMPSYRRYPVPGGGYFFIINLLVRHIVALRKRVTL